MRPVLDFSSPELSSTIEAMLPPSLAPANVVLHSVLLSDTGAFQFLGGAGSHSGELGTALQDKALVPWVESAAGPGATG